MFRKYHIYDKFSGMEVFKNIKFDFSRLKNLIVFISIDRILRGIKYQGMAIESMVNPRLQDEFLKIEEVINFLGKTLQNWEDNDIHHFKSLYVLHEKKLVVWGELKSIEESHPEIFKLFINKIPSACDCNIPTSDKCIQDHKCIYCGSENLDTQANTKFQTFRSTKADLIEADRKKKIKNFSHLWNFVFELNEKDVLNNFAGCAESNLLEYLATHPDILDESGNHIIFTVMNSSVSSTKTKEIEICSPCLYCCWVFPHYYDLIGQSRLIKWGTYREHYKEGANAYIPEHIFLHLVSEGRLVDFQRYYETWSERVYQFSRKHYLSIGSKYTVLHHACSYHSQTGFVKFILDKEPDLLNSKTYFNRTSLHFAVMNCHPRIVEYLLNCPGIEINSKDHTNLTPFNHSVISRNGEIINLFLQKEGVDVSYDAVNDHPNFLIAASSFSTLEVVKKVYKMMAKLGKGFDINYVYQEENITALSQAIDRNAVDIFDFLLGKGANVYKPVAKGWNLEAIFLRLIHFRRWDMMRSFLYFHMDEPDKLKKLQNMKMGDNATALHMVVKRAQSVNHVEMLTKLGFKMNEDNDGVTPLQIATEGSDIQKHLEKYILQRDVKDDTDCIERAPKLWRGLSVNDFEIDPFIWL
ncbi:uncharacterized protein LOC118437075 [Folsomia candida]|nr:uncharacterized protein LOC118437075 [Folsomia candida]